MARRQSVGGNAKRGSLFCGCIAGDLRRRTFFGDVAEIAGTFDRAPALRGVSGFLPAAAGGPEFFSDEPVAGLLSEGVGSLGTGRGAVRGAALAESGAGTTDAGGRGCNVVAVLAR